MTHYCLTSPKKDQKSNLLSVNYSKSLSGALNTLKFISVFSLYLPIISYDKQKTLNPKLSHSRSVLRHLIGWILGLSSSHSAPHLSRWTLRTRVLVLPQLWTWHSFPTAPPSRDVTLSKPILIKHHWSKILGRGPVSDNQTCGVDSWWKWAPALVHQYILYHRVRLILVSVNSPLLVNMFSLCTVGKISIWTPADFASLATCKEMCDL